jgi:hypothetical protein
MAEYTETETKHLFYNGGDRISEALQYSLPEGHDIHCTARWPMEAPERDFFNVPKILVIGGARVSIPFVETILRTDRFGGRGVILVDANWEPPADKAEAEKMPVATTRELAIEKGNRHWDAYVKKVAQQWIDECNEARSRGGVPRGASGFVARALKLCGLADPATAVIAQAQESKSNKSEIDELKDLVRAQGDQIAQLTNKAKATNEPKSTPRSRSAA